MCLNTHHASRGAAVALVKRPSSFGPRRCCALWTQKRCFYRMQIYLKLFMKLLGRPKTHRIGETARRHAQASALRTSITVWLVVITWARIRSQARSALPSKAASMIAWCSS